MLLLLPLRRAIIQGGESSTVSIKLTQDVIEFLDSVKRHDKHEHIDHVSALVRRYSCSRELAEQLRVQYVEHIFINRIPFNPEE